MCQYLFVIDLLYTITLEHFAGANVGILWIYELEVVGGLCAGQ